jgi:hypothetical protein
VRNKGRDIALSLHLDRITARLDALEAVLGVLRAEVDRLTQLAAEDVDDATEPHPGGPWRGHEVVEQAVQMIEPHRNGNGNGNGNGQPTTAPPTTNGTAGPAGDPT